MSSHSIITIMLPPKLRIARLTEEGRVIWVDEISESRVGQCPACDQYSVHPLGRVIRLAWATPWRQQPTRRRIRLRQLPVPEARRVLQPRPDRYYRTVSEMARRGFRVRGEIDVRSFSCFNPACDYAIFCEWLLPWVGVSQKATS